MPDLAELNLSIKSNQVTSATSAMDRMTASAQKLEGAAGRVSGAFTSQDGVLGKLAGSYQKIMGLMAGVAAGAGILGAAFKAIQAAADYEQIEVGFTTLLHSASAAKELLSDINKFAVETPFEFPGLAVAGKQLLAFGFQAKEIIPILTQVGDAASAVGTGQEGMMSIIDALGKMKTQGQLTTLTLNQLAFQGINARKYLADAFGVSVPEAMQKVQDGAVGAKKGIDIILQGFTKDFANGMKMQSTTVAVLWSILSDNIKMAMRDVGQTLIEAFRIPSTLGELIKQTDYYKKVVIDTVRVLTGLPKQFDDIGNSAEKAAAAIRRIAAVVLAIGATIATISTVGAIISTIAALSNPITLVAVAIGAAAGAIAYFWDSTVQWGKDTVSVGDIVVATFEEIWDVIKVGGGYIMDILKDVWENAKFWFEDMGETAGGVFGIILKVIDAFWDKIKRLANFIIAIVQTIMDTWTIALARIMSAIMALGDIDFSHGLKAFVTSAKQAQLQIQEAMNPANYMKDLWTAASENFGKDYVGGFVKGIKDGANMLIDEWGKIIDNIHKRAAERAADREAQQLIQLQIRQWRGEKRRGPSPTIDTAPEEDTSGVAKVTEAIKNLEKEYALLGLIGDARERAAAKNMLETAGVDMNNKKVQEYLALLEKVLAKKQEVYMRDQARNMRNEYELIGANPVEAARIKSLQDSEAQGYERTNAAVQELARSQAQLAKAKVSNDYAERNKDIQLEIDMLGKNAVQVDIMRAQRELEKSGLQSTDAAYKQHIETLKAYHKAQQDQDMKDRIQDLELENSLIGKSDVERKIAIESLDLERKGYDLASDSVQKYFAALRKNDELKRLDELAKSIGDSFGDAFTDAIMGAKSLMDVVKDLGMAIEREIIQQMVARPVAQMITGTLGGFLGNIFGGAAAAPATASAKGNVFYKGSVIPFADGGVVNRETYFPMSGGRMGVMGEAGTEGIFPLTRDGQGRLGVRAGGSGGTTVVNQTFNITTNDADSFRRSKTQISNDMKRAANGKK